ncbi:hypothetical protein V9L20_27065 [Variovorax sp. CCNWLW225]|uniref:hypothetical protein n=1 Tax=Variovorax sp. CCNWLW225 TaxID=3127462 RepID=UPI0030772646
MKIRNNINQKLKIRINKCIDLLDTEYKKLNFTIDPYISANRLEYERKNKPDLSEETYEQILNGSEVVSGITLGEKKRIKIFLFIYKNLETDANEVLGLIGNIYHEIRHGWQIEHKLFDDEIGITKIDGNLETYFGQVAEKDAYTFQLEQMQKNANKILEIFNINDRVQYYTLKEEIMDIINQ